MSSSFIEAAGKRVTDIHKFIREASEGNGIKYVAVRGEDHHLYIPYVEETVEENGETHVERQIIAKAMSVHDWNMPDGKHRCCGCLDGITIKDDSGAILNNGNCPMCARVDDAWNIFNYRKDKADKECTLVGDARVNELKTKGKQFADELKIRKPKDYVYVLVCKFNLNKDGDPIISKTTKLPEYELKVMKMSSSRSENIEKQLKLSGSGSFAGSEIIISYPDIDEKMLLVSKSTTVPIFGDKAFVTGNKELLANINKQVSEFTWDGIEKAFPEWAGLTDSAAKSLMDESFELWDKYSAEKKVNPDAKYLEYNTQATTAKPDLSGATAGDKLPDASGTVQMPDVNAMFGDSNSVPKI